MNVKLNGVSTGTREVCLDSGKFCFYPECEGWKIGLSINNPINSQNRDYLITLKTDEMIWAEEHDI